MASKPSRMVNFLDAAYDLEASGSSGATIIQLVDLAPIAAELGTTSFLATASAFCNRVQVDAETDTRFQLLIWAFEGTVSEFPQAWDLDPPPFLGEAEANVFTDPDLETWELLECSFVIPADSGYLAVLFTAVEDVFNDVTGTEFDGHFGDAVTFTIEEIVPPLLFIGSNDLGEETPSYIRTVACGLPEPLTLAEVGFPNMHVVMSVYYRVANLLRGDADGDGTVNPLSDAIYILDHQFGGGPPPPCLESADVDDDAVFNGLADGIFLLSYGFLGGMPPPPPFPACGPDPDPATSLGCESHPGCP